MDQGQGKADRDACKTGSRSLRRCADNDEQEKEGHHHFVDEAAPEAIFAWTKSAIAVGSESVGNPGGLARCNEPQYRSGHDGGDDLGNNVRNDMLAGAAPGAPQADRDRGIEMSSGNVTDGISHRQHGQPECKCYTEKADTEVGKPRRQDCSTATAEYQPKRAKELGDNAPRHIVVHRCPPTLTSYTLPVENRAHNHNLNGTEIGAADKPADAIAVGASARAPQ